MTTAEARNACTNICGIRVLHQIQGTIAAFSTQIGGQISGGPSVGELMNTIALAIQKKVTVRELDMMQIATHPLLASAPTVHPLINASHQALAKLRSTIKSAADMIQNRP